MGRSARNPPRTAGPVSPITTSLPSGEVRVAQPNFRMGSTKSRSVAQKIGGWMCAAKYKTQRAMPSLLGGCHGLSPVPTGKEMSLMPSVRSPRCAVPAQPELACALRLMRPSQIEDSGIPISVRSSAWNLKGLQARARMSHVLAWKELAAL